MPSTSAKQRKFMRAAAHSPGFAKRAGISQAVARDFARHDGTYAAGGRAMMLPQQFGALVAPRGIRRMAAGGALAQGQPTAPVPPEGVGGPNIWSGVDLAGGAGLIPGTQTPFIPGRGPWPLDYGGGRLPGTETDSGTETDFIQGQTDFIPGQGPRPMWWPEDRPWAPGDIGYGVGALGGKTMPMLPDRPGVPGGIFGALGALGTPPPYNLDPPDMSFGGGGGGMARGGAVGALGALPRYDLGGGVDRDAGYGGGGGGAWGGGEREAPADARDLADLLGERAPDPDKMRESKEIGRSAIGWGQALAEAIQEHARASMLSPEKLVGMAPFGIGAVATLGQIAARANEKTGGYNDYGGGGTDAGIHGDGALGTSPAPIAPDGALQAPAAPAPAPALRLPLLQQPQFDPRTYGFGPALAWLR